MQSTQANETQASLSVEEQGRLCRREYDAAWRKRNKERTKGYMTAYWERKGQAMIEAATVETQARAKAQAKADQFDADVRAYLKAEAAKGSNSPL